MMCIIHACPIQVLLTTNLFNDWWWWRRGFVVFFFLSAQLHKYGCFSALFRLKGFKNSSLMFMSHEKQHLRYDVSSQFRQLNSNPSLSARGKHLLFSVLPSLFKFFFQKTFILILTDCYCAARCLESCSVT